MANDFGALTDHFGILAIVDGDGTLGDILKLQDSENGPIPEDRADATDESGDIVASTYFGNDGGTIKDATSKFVVKSGTLDTALLKIGEVATGKVIESISIDTNNKGWPTIEVKGKLGTPAFQAPTGKTASATLPSFDIKGAKLAQPISFTYGVGCRLTSCKMTASGKIEDVKDGMGEPVAYGISFEVVEVAAEFQRVSAEPTWTVTSPMIEKQKPTTKEPSAEYHTSSASGEMPLARDDT